ncbi:Uncharacterised protein [Mycobacteroides abscessus subsp. abscessus]|nr:Uncharacterised protein [Mycobacteroides abscessus subsp. abscessus]
MLGRLARPRSYRDVELARVHPVDERRRDGFADRDVDPGVIVVHARDGVEDGLPGESAHGAYPQCPCGEAAQIVGQSDDRVDSLDRPAYGGQYSLSFARQRHASCGALQQCDPQFVLELANLSAHTRLADVQSRRRSGERSGVDDREEVAELMQFHDSQ